MTHSSKDPRRILFVDDEEGQLKLYSTLLSNELPWNIQITKFPTEALALAGKRLYDVIVIDVTMDYNGSPFGGLELYRQLSSRYGSDSLVVYSKFITEDLLKRYNYPFNFIEIGDDPVAFAERLARRVTDLRKRQRCFVAMPFGKEFTPVWRSIHRAVRRALFEPVRIDKKRFNSSIIDEIVRDIRDAKVVLFVATSMNPNVFYEVGFAHALSKEIVTITDKYSSLPFDVRDLNAIAYGEDLERFEKRLAVKLSDLG